MNISLLVILVVGVIWLFHIPSYIADEYFGRKELRGEVVDLCAVAYNFTRVPLDQGPCQEALSGIPVDSQRMANVPLCDKDGHRRHGHVQRSHVDAYECAPAENPAAG